MIDQVDITFSLPGNPGPTGLLDIYFAQVHQLHNILLINKRHMSTPCDNPLPPCGFGRGCGGEMV